MQPADYPAQRAKLHVGRHENSELNIRGLNILPLAVADPADIAPQLKLAQKPNDKALSCVSGRHFFVQAFGSLIR